MDKSEAKSLRKRHSAGRCCVVVLVLMLIVAAVFVIGITLGLQRLTKDDYVKTAVGRIKGRTVEVPGGLGQVDEYLGIPYAEPPVGNLRFSDPVPLQYLPQGYETGEDHYHATSVKDLCIGNSPDSDSEPVSEDCLYLNIWVPQHSTHNLATMVWIKSQSFYNGENTHYDGVILAARGNIIVVTFNYRVGSFGFLGTGDGRVKGNFGMKDQVLALQWIKDNIVAFDGNPNRVTLFGQGLGASNIGLHMVSNYSKELFYRAIYESGSPQSDWSLMTADQASQRSSTFLEAVHCTQRDRQNLLACLRKVEAQVISSTNEELVDLYHVVFPWVPIVDGDFLRDTPHNLLKDGRVHKKDSILGVNSHEGSLWLYNKVYKFIGYDPALINSTQLLSALYEINWDIDEELWMRINIMYDLDDQEGLEAFRGKVVKLIGDRSFVCPIEELTYAYTDLGMGTYLYYLTYRSSENPWPQWMGVNHGAELQWLFGMPVKEFSKYTPEEKGLSDIIISYWTNFAKYGDPYEFAQPVWREYNKENQPYLEFGTERFNRFPDIIMGTHLGKSHKCGFWNNITRKNNGRAL